MNKLDRYKVFINYLKRNNFIESQKDLGKKLGYTNESSFSQIINGKVNEPDNFADRLTAICPELNPIWLNTGEGEMLKTTSVTRTDSSDKYSLVPMYNLDARGGFGTNDEIDAAEYIVDEIPFKDAKRGDICVPVSGDSMLPTYCAGTIILLHEIAQWREFLEYGQIYVLILNDGRRLLKEIRPSEEDKKTKILCVSHNTKYDPAELSKDFINKVFLVTALYQKTTM